jgi:phytoene dehydrogenase-like protein
LTTAGAGLGGLLSGVSLAKKGHKISIFERLPYHGGRFTNIEHKGYQLSTGALHLIPHGSSGPLGTMLNSQGIKVPIVRTSPPGLFRIDGKDYTHNQLLDLFGSWNKVKLVKLMADLRYAKGGDESYLEWVRKRISHKKVSDMADSFCRWALSLNADQVSSREVISITKNIDKYGSAGVPIGGCKAVVDGLYHELKQHGAEIFYQSSASEILIDDGEVKGLTVGDEPIEFDSVISNVGPKATASLCENEVLNKDYLSKTANSESANGIKISFSSDQPLVGTTTTLFTPDAERVGGLVELTHIDRSLAPKGKHLIMSHQKLYGKNVKKEIESGLEDLRNILPGFEKHCEVLMVQTYRNHWPVNRVSSGTHIGPETGVKGLYNVGDGIKPVGFMETEGVAAGVGEMLEKFNKEMHEV